jgi:dimethylhistidine N-methyltransferase
VDLDAVRAVRGLHAHGLLSRILGRLLRRRALRAQGRIARHCARAAARELPQLVPPAVPLRVRQLQDGLPLTSAFARDVADGFARTPKRLPPRWLYDDLGSALFEAICRLPWYRITRAEAALIAAHGPAIVDACPGDLEIVELGGGNGEKLDLLLDAVAARGREASVRLIDISQAALDAARARLEGRAGVASVHVTRDHFEPALAALPARAQGRLVLFLGSNIGNFDPDDARVFLRLLCRAAGPEGAVMLGADLVKPEADLLLAYDDPLQVTAAFNRNVLVRMNRELGADFPVDAFSHQAIWNAPASRVEMRLVALRAVDARIVGAAVDAHFEPGDWIWTESSYKYTTGEVETMARDAGMDAGAGWIDPAAQFALWLLRPRGPEEKAR